MPVRLFAALLALAMSLPAACPAHAAPAEWTLLYYMAADNDLARAAVDDVNELESAPGHPDVQAVVLLDVSAQTYPVPVADGEPEWDGARVLRIRPDSDPDRITSPALKELGQVNTGDPNLLRRFVEFAAEACPAKRYALFVWNHGTGWKTIPYGEPGATVSDAISKAKFPGLPDLSGQVSRSIGYDDVARDSLTLAELSGALAASAASTGRPFDLLVFDACLMQMAEIVDAVAPAANFVLASEEVTPDSGYRHHDLLARFARSPRADGERMGRELAVSFIEGHRPPNRPMPAQISLVNLAKVAPFKAALASFASACARPAHAPALRSALRAAKKFRMSEYADLAHFAKLSASFIEGGEVVSAAAGLREALDALVVENLSNDDRFADCGGLAIYLPDGKIDPAYARLPFAASSGWLALLRLALESDEGARVEATDAWVDDPGADGRLSSGEESRLVFAVKNRGRAPLSAGSFELRASSPDVRLVAGKVADLDLAPGAKANLTFRVVSDASADANEDTVFTLHLAQGGQRILVGRHVARLAPAFEKRGTLLLVTSQAGDSSRMVESACSAAGIPLDRWHLDREGPLTRSLLKTWRGAVVLRLFPETGSALAYSAQEDALLSDHLRRGGRLIVSGQDFAFRYAESKLCRLFGIRVASDAVETRTLAFRDNSLGLDLNGEDTPDNQYYMDSFAETAGLSPVIHYVIGESGDAALAGPVAALLGAAKSGPGRVLFLGFGVDGISGADRRGEALRKFFALLAVDPGIAVADVAKDHDDLLRREGIDAHLAEDLAQGRLDRAQAFLDTAATADPATRETLSAQVRTVLDYARARLMEGEPDRASAAALDRLAADAAALLEGIAE